MRQTHLDIQNTISYAIKLPAYAGPASGSRMKKLIYIAQFIYNYKFYTFKLINHLIDDNGLINPNNSSG